MAVRKNAKFLTASEREDFVKACVLMKADIVNPGAPAISEIPPYSAHNARNDSKVASKRMVARVRNVVMTRLRSVVAG